MFQEYFKNEVKYNFVCCEFSLLTTREHLKWFFFISNVKLLFLSVNTAIFSVGLCNINQRNAQFINYYFNF